MFTARRQRVRRAPVINCDQMDTNTTYFIYLSYFVIYINATFQTTGIITYDVITGVSST